MTEAELAAIEARAEAATEGPWSPEALEVWSPHGLVADAAPAVHDARNPKPDADFIAHARQDVPALVAEVRRLAYRLSEAERWQTTAKEAVRGLPVGSERAIGHPVADAVLVLKRALEKAEREVADLAGLKDVVARLQAANAALRERLED